MIWATKRRFWKRVGNVSLIIFALIATALSVHMYRIQKEQKAAVYSLKQQLKELQKEVYVAGERLPKGTVLTKDKVYRRIIYSDEPIEKFITEEAFGMKTIVDVEPETGLMVNMLQNTIETVTTRTVFFSEAEIAEHIQNGDRVDVRIRYHNAEDYTVLSDKILVKSELGKGMMLELTEEEILLISSAIADCAKYKGTKLYVVEYPEHKPTETGQVTYIPNLEVLKMLKKETKEGESRIALEQRLKQEKQ